MGFYYGKSVEAAIDSALKELNATKEQVEITVIEEAKAGILGIGAHQAKVSVELKVDDAKKAADFLDGLFDILKVPAQTEIKENGDKIVLDVLTTSPTQVIGYRGEMLDALQTLASAAANVGNEDYKRVVVNCENYREKREETLKALALRLADKAVKYGKKFSLEPMNPFERKVIHSALTGNENVKTESQGVEPNRYIVIIPNNLKPSSKPERDRKHSRDRKPREEKSQMIGEKKQMGYGTFLGNSLK
ncbi:MAG: protein jag [Clostridia bacterium]|nr:protein jag [Clostridia bacterium]